MISKISSRVGPTKMFVNNPTEQTIVDPILTNTSEYISVGNNQYLMFVDPEVTYPLIVGDGEYLSVGENQYLKFVES